MTKSTMEEHPARSVIEAAAADRSLLAQKDVREAIEQVIADLDRGALRVVRFVDAGPSSDKPTIETQAWVKTAILLYFALRSMETTQVGPFEFHDKIPLKTGYASGQVRVVPPAVVRYGAYIEPGAVLMPSYVNLGAWVGSGTMVDTWATVGSCAQIGRDCHLAGGVGIGGVLEPAGAQPVIIEDGCFLGSRAIVVEGVHVGREAVLGAGVVLTASTLIVDVSGTEPVEMKGYIPPRSVVVPGVRPRRFPAGEFGIPCALILGKRSESTDKKVSLNQALRDFNVSVG